MSVIKQKGVPTRKTKGAVGDVYINTQTGDKYNCTFAYNDGINAEYTWHPTGKTTVAKEEKPVVAEVKQPAKVEPVEVKVEVEEESIEQPETGKQRTNYSKHFNS